MLNFLNADVSCLLSTLNLSFNFEIKTLVFQQEFFYTFFYLLFVSITPAFYISPVSDKGSLLKHYTYMGLIYFFSFLFLFSNNLFFFIIFYEAIIFPIFLILREFGHYYRKTQASFFILI
jgi:hypothetical protein